VFVGVGLVGVRLVGTGGADLLVRCLLSNRVL